MERVIGYIGRKAIHSINHILDLFAFTYRILNVMVTNPRQGRALIARITTQQLYFTAVQALPVIIPIALLVGTMVLESEYTFWTRVLFFGLFEG